MLLFISFALLVSHLTSINCNCAANAVLPVESKVVIEHGYKYEQLFVNKSIPINVTFRFALESSQLDDMEWYFGDRHLNIDTNPSKDFYYSIQPEQGSSTVTLHFRAPTPRISGKWKLVVTSPEKEQFTSVCFVTSDPIIHRPSATARGNVGRQLSVTCAIDTYPPPTELKWRKVVCSPDGTTHLEPVVNATYKEHDGLPNGVMEFESATESTSGFYLCTAVSSTRQDNWLFEVRIKGYRTLLWPCIGILIELIVLGVIIGVYEHFQTKRRKAEEKQL